MLMIKHGDLFQNAKPPCIIVHGCNAQGKMNSGFAKQLRHHFPEAYLDYYNTHQDSPLMVGEVVLTKISRADGDYHIANAITQEFYGRDRSIVYVDYDAVAKTLKWVADGAKKFQHPVHLPFIGGDLANGDRDRLLVIFKDAFKDVDATLWLFAPPDLRKGA